MEKILVVDDDPDILEALCWALESEGYKVEATTKGGDTVRLVQQFTPHLVILDILLSGLDGRHIAKKLKSDSKTMHIPVVMISASPSTGDTVRAYGADDFIAKPFELVDLIDKIKSHITKTKSKQHS